MSGAGMKWRSPLVKRHPLRGMMWGMGSVWRQGCCLGAHPHTHTLQAVPLSCVGATTTAQGDFLSGLWHLNAQCCGQAIFLQHLAGQAWSAC